MDAADRRRRLLARVFALLTIISGVYYINWAIGAVNPAHPIVAKFFIFAEVCSLALFVIATVGVWRLRYKPTDRARHRSSI